MCFDWVMLSAFALVDVVRTGIDAVGCIAYYVSFGPHGTRHPVSKPGESNKIVLGILAALGATGLLWTTARSYGEHHRISKKRTILMFLRLAHEPPKTLTKEWEHAATERAKEQKMNPITGTFEGPCQVACTYVCFCRYLVGRL
jgi:hypothetical protein